MLLDTGVLIDVALDRRPHSDPASEILDQLEHGAQNAFMAWHTVSVPQAEAQPPPVRDDYQICFEASHKPTQVL